MTNLNTFRNKIYLATDISSIFEETKKRMGVNYVNLPLNLEEFTIVLYFCVNFFLDNNLVNLIQYQNVFETQVMEKVGENKYVIAVPSTVYSIYEVTPSYFNTKFAEMGGTYGGDTFNHSTPLNRVISPVTRHGEREAIDFNRGLLSLKTTYSFDFLSSKLFINTNRYNIIVRGSEYTDSIINFIQRTDFVELLELSCYDQMYKNVAMLVTTDESVLFSLDFLKDKSDLYFEKQKVLAEENSDTLLGFGFA